MPTLVRAYHFAAAQYALDDLRNRRLKKARLDDLNDPFDLMAVAQPHPQTRSDMRAWKEAFAAEFAMVCFSLAWQNPLLWSHYADRHRGIALGFDIPVEKIKRVRYTKKLPPLQAVDAGLVEQLLYLKYFDWRYEQEVRVFTRLGEKDSSSGLYFAAFDEDCILREVIVGPLSSVIESEVLEALGTHQVGVTLTNARLAFNSFNVVKNQRYFQKGSD